MKKLHIYLVFLASLFVLSCQTQLPDPDTDAVYKSITKTYELNEDGTLNYRYQHQLKYLTHYAFNRAHGESFIVYNPDKQALKINESLTIQKDGNKVQSPKNAYNEVLPRFAAGAPYFNHLREMVVTHAGLELGCLVHFDYELKSHSDYIPFLNEGILLAERSPVQKMEIIVKIPTGKELNHKLLNSSVVPTVKTKKGITIYKWKFENLQARSFDRDQTHYNEDLPTLVFSTATVNQALNHFTTEDELTETIVTSLKEKLKEAKTDFEKITTLQNVVANEINYFKTPIQHTGYKVRNFEEIWKTNGATRFEKAFLLAQTLKEFNFEAKPVFAIPELVFDKNLGIYSGHPYVMVNLNDEKLIISPVSTRAKNNLTYKLSNSVLLDFEGNVIDIDKSKINVADNIKIDGEFTISKKGTLKGELEATVSGSVNPYFDLLKDEANVDAIAKKIIAGSKISQAELKEWDSEGISINFKAEIKEAIKTQENYHFLNIPKTKMGLASKRLATLTEQRISPFNLGKPVDESYSFQITVPENFNLINGVIDTTISNEIGSAHINIVKNENVIDITKKIEIKKGVISIEEYSNFRDLYLLWTNRSFEELIIKEEM